MGQTSWMNDVGNFDRGINRSVSLKPNRKLLREFSAGAYSLTVIAKRCGIFGCMYNAPPPRELLHGEAATHIMRGRSAMRFLELK
jgi:hypothetical protein